MQLQQNIPTLGGLAEAPGRSRREQLALDGEQARREIAALLQRARKRALLLAAARALALLLAGLSLALLCGALIASVDGALFARIVAGFLAAAAAGLVVWFSLRSPLQRGAARDPRLIARLIGGPSELLSSVELSREDPSGVSTELLSLLHLRAAASAKKIDLARALPGSSLRGPFLVLAASGLVWLLAASFAPRYISHGLARLWRGDSGAPPVELSPIAGDLSITYLYPSYTGLPPRTEEGTAGDLRAPRGTEVRLLARADRDLAQAFAVVNGAALKLEASGPGRRQLSGTLQLSQPGQWSLRFTDSRGRVLAEGPSRPIEIVADQPPQATIDAPRQAVLEVDPQGKVPIAWSAADDYGLTQVTLVWQRAGAKEERVTLQAPSSPAKRLRGAYTWELAPLRLRPGDRVSYHLEAKDNDAVDGPQRGLSASQAIKVFSAAEHSRESLIRAQALWERLVALLGDRLEEKPPPTDEDALGSWYMQTAQRDRDARALSQELYSAGSELLKDKLSPKALGRALRYVSTSLGPAVHRTSLARAPLSRGVEGREGAVRSFSSALRGEVREEEKDVLYLQDLLDRARLDAMQELGKELAASRRELGRLAEKLRKAEDEETRRELLSEVERLRERIQDLMSRMAELAKGIQDEHLNREAAESMEKEQDLLGQLSDIQKKLQSGKIDEALKQLDRLSQQLEKLERDLQQRAGQQQSGQYAQEAKALREAADQLKDLQAKEQDLEKRTAGLRREMRSQAQKRFEQKGGKQLAAELQRKAEAARKAIAQIDPKVAEHLGLEDTLDMAQGRASDLSRALETGDFDEALDLAERAERAVETLQGRLTMEDQVAQRYPGFSRDPAGVRRSLRASGEAQQPLQEIVQRLSDALPREGQGMSQEQVQRLRQQGQEQGRLKDQLSRLRDQLGEVGKKVPIFGPQHEQMLQQAQEGMSGAEQRLHRAEPRGAQAGEQQAIEKLAQFQDAMEKMAKQAGKGSGQGGMPMPWGEPSQENGDEEGQESADGVRHDKVEIPDAESSRAPAEFRKELLDAMKQAPPEKYKERVKQYYEELVK
ncbi:MAG TPA: DUF4175 family protein [Myxococcales bacterium]|nr:DUF4175 family protein [Myxococcales bacterium]